MIAHSGIFRTLAFATGVILVSGAALGRQQSQSPVAPNTAPASTATASNAVPDAGSSSDATATVAGPTLASAAKSAAAPGAASGSAASGPAPVVRENGESLVEGEKRFATNCGRCDQSPHHFPPRMMATIIRHMRVRATITDEDMRLILRYLRQ